MVLACADSRTAPEFVFAQSLGKLFVCRVGGNIVEPGTLASFEFALTQFGSIAALVVLGHQRCGAVTAAVGAIERGGDVPQPMKTIVDAIRPAVAATPRGKLNDEAYIDAVVGANAHGAAREIVAQSDVIRDAVAAGALKIVAARYSLDSGKVDVSTSPITSPLPSF